MVNMLAVIVCLCTLFGQITSSAIPMWEFLSKDEKMSYLYSMFANQVDEFCQGSRMVDCNRQLLKYGLNRLKAMPEDHLDIMDPYQRGANNIIWEAMMQGHMMMKTTPSPTVDPITTAKPNSYEDDSFASFSAASAKIENVVYRVATPKGAIETLTVGQPLYYRPSNRHQMIGGGGDGIDDGRSNARKWSPYTKFQQLHSGPMVVRVHPDGRPVIEATAAAAAAVPYDEDLRQYQMSKVRIPNL